MEDFHIDVMHASYTLLRYSLYAVGLATRALLKALGLAADTQSTISVS